MGRLPIKMADVKAETDETKDPEIDYEDGGNEGDLEEMKQRLEEMQEEAEKLKEIQSQMDESGGANAKDADARSIYVGGVDYSATPEELQALFVGCGMINRVTILCNKYTGQSKGYAYVEFAEKEAVKNALHMNDQQFKGRPIKVVPKRTNIPGFKFGGKGYGRGGGKWGGKGGWGKGYRGGYKGYKGYSP